MQAPEAFYQDQFASTACDKDDVGHLRRPAASALAECSPQVHNAVGAVVISCHVHSIATYFQDGPGWSPCFQGPNWCDPMGLLDQP